MKHRKETLEYNTDVFKHTDLDSNGYLEWEEYIGMVRDYTCRVLPIIHSTCMMITHQCLLQITSLMYIYIVCFTF